MKILQFSILLVIAIFCSNVQAGVISVTNDSTGTGRTSFGANDTMDWGTLGTNFTVLSNPFIGTSTGGLNMTVSQSGGSFERRDLGSGWGGNFTDGSNLLWTGGSNGPISIVFDSLISGIGFQINPNHSETRTIVELFNSSDISMGLFDLTTNNRSTQSASFLGFSSSMQDIAKLTISMPTREDFSINQLSLITDGGQTVPEPGTLVLLGLGLAGLGFSRKARSK